MMIQTNEYNNFTYALQEMIPIIPQKSEPAPLRCTVIVTAEYSEFAVFMRMLRQKNLIDDSYSIIEMRHTERRFTFIQNRNLLIVQLGNMHMLKSLRICPDRIILTGTARCFNVRKAPCDTVVMADTVWDMERNAHFVCSFSKKWFAAQGRAVPLQLGSYFSETDVQSVYEMQQEADRWERYLAFDAESCTFAQICHAAGWEWAVVKGLTNDLSIPNRRMREYAAELAAESVIGILERNTIIRVRSV